MFTTSFAPTLSGQFPSPEDTKMTFQGIYTQAKLLRQELHKFNQLHKYEIVTIGQEGIGSFLAKIFYGIINTMGHIVSTLGTNLANLVKWDALKRSELQYWHQSNIATSTHIFHMDLSSISELKVPVPDKMSSSYLDTTKTILEFLTFLDMTNRIKAVSESTKHIVTSLRDGDTKLNIDVILKKMDLDIVNLAKQFKREDDCFKGKKTPTEPRFAYVFPRTSDFSSVDTLLLDNVHHFKSVSGVYKTLQDMEELFQSYIKDLENNKVTSLDTKALESMSAYCTVIARLADMFGVSVQDYQRMDHNFVAVIDVIRNQLQL